MSNWQTRLFAFGRQFSFKKSKWQAELGGRVG